MLFRYANQVNNFDSTKHIAKNFLRFGTDLYKNVELTRD